MAWRGKAELWCWWVAIMWLMATSCSGSSSEFGLLEERPCVGFWAVLRLWGWRYLWVINNQYLSHIGNALYWPLASDGKLAFPPSCRSVLQHKMLSGSREQVSLPCYAFGDSVWMIPVLFGRKGVSALGVVGKKYSIKTCMENPRKYQVFSWYFPQTLCYLWLESLLPTQFILISSVWLQNLTLFFMNSL